MESSTLIAIHLILIVTATSFTLFKWWMVSRRRAILSVDDFDFTEKDVEWINKHRHRKCKACGFPALSISTTSYVSIQPSIFGHPRRALLIRCGFECTICQTLQHHSFARKL